MITRITPKSYHGKNYSGSDTYTGIGLCVIGNRVNREKAIGKIEDIF